MNPTLGLNMDLKIIHAADIETDIGNVNNVSYTGLSFRFLFARRAREMVMNSVIGTFMAAIVSVCRKAGRKSFLPYVYA